jgi:hypothetical protein
MKEAKKWMVVPYEENAEKVVNSKLDTIIKDSNIKDENKLYMYNNELKKGFNQIPKESIESRKIDSNDTKPDIDLTVAQLKKQIESLDKQRKNEISQLQSSLGEIMEDKEIIDESLLRQPFEGTRIARKRRRLNKITSAPKISRIVSKLSKPEILTNPFKTSIKDGNKVLNWEHELSLIGDSLNNFNLNDSKMVIE